MRPVRMLGLAAAAFTLACSDGAQPPTAPTDVSLAKSGNEGISFIESFSVAYLNPSPDLWVDGKIKGLGAGVTVYVTLTALGERFDACVNGGENVPADPKKKKTTDQSSFTFPVTGDGGSTAFSAGPLTLPATSLNCPPGQLETLFSGSWSNIVLSTPAPAGGPVIQDALSGVSFSF